MRNKLANLLGWRFLRAGLVWIHSYLASQLDNRPGLLGWLWRHRHERVVRNSCLSIVGWLLMYGVFYVEVSHLNLDSQHAKLTISPLGFPVGLTIQWLVFRDRITVAQVGTGFRAIPKRVWLTTLQTSKKVGSRYWPVKAVSFVVNQYAYAMMLHKVGLPYWLAYPAAASALSLVYYKMNNVWVFADKWWEGPVMSRLVYRANNLWLAWTIGPIRQIETA